MSVTFTQGNMFETDVDAIVNTVNCVGVMGKGVALEFKKRWPDNYLAYKDKCVDKEIRPGRVFIFERKELFDDPKPKYLINFPTKNHWRGKSKLEYIRDGLDDLVEQLKDFEIHSIAMPPLGCGNGGLNWAEVKEVIESKLSLVKSVDFLVYEPISEISEPEFQGAFDIRTPERAAYIRTLGELESAFGGSFTKLVLHKIAYFFQASQMNMNLSFAKQERGPYSEEMKIAIRALISQNYLNAMESDDEVFSISPSAFAAADDYLNSGSHDDVIAIAQKVALLVDGFESPYGMELLSSVHFVKPSSSDDAIEKLYAWNESKKRFPEAHIVAAYNRLTEDKYLSNSKI